jgi:hypothetical protein
LWYTETDTLYLTTDGGRVYQHFVYLVPMRSAFAALPHNSRQKRCNCSPPRTVHRRLWMSCWRPIR